MSRLSLPLGIMLLASAALGADSANRSVKTKEDSSATGSRSGTNAIPRSVFVVPTVAEQGRDPFFPLSTRLREVPIVAPTPDPVAPVRLRFQGVSGTPDNRLAIISGRTMAEGETAEFGQSTTKIVVRCIEIRTDACVIEIGSERQTLPLGADK